MRFSGSTKVARYGLATAMLAMAAGLAVAASPLHATQPGDTRAVGWEKRGPIVVQVQQAPVSMPLARPGELPMSDARPRTSHTIATTAN